MGLNQATVSQTAEAERLAGRAAGTESSVSTTSLARSEAEAEAEADLSLLDKGQKGRERKGELELGVEIAASMAEGNVLRGSGGFCVAGIRL